jgi:hypothetical protein
MSIKGLRASTPDAHALIFPFVYKLSFALKRNVRFSFIFHLNLKISVLTKANRDLVNIHGIGELRWLFKRNGLSVETKVAAL